uniref:Interferon gamma n=1 Tax=Steinernema glaseri TaxID=37863 RepID=A0A1I7YGA1_9BILA
MRLLVSLLGALAILHISESRAIDKENTTDIRELARILHSQIRFVLQFDSELLSAVEKAYRTWENDPFIKNILQRVYAFISDDSDEEVKETIQKLLEKKIPLSSERKEKQEDERAVTVGSVEVRNITVQMYNRRNQTGIREAKVSVPMFHKKRINVHKLTLGQE